MKKILSIILALVCLFTLLSAATVSAIEAPIISISSKEANAGDEVVLDVSLENNPGIAYLKLTIDYNAADISVVKAENKGVLSGTFTTSKTTSVKPYVLQWMGAEDSADNGVIATITLKVSENTTGGSLPVTMSIAECYNQDFSDVTLQANSGNITVKSTVDANAKATVESKGAKAGDTVSLNVALSNAAAASSLAFSDITYNSEALTLESAEWVPNDADISDWNEEDGRGVLGYEKEKDLNGDVLKLTFKVKDNAEEGEYTVGTAFYLIINDVIYEAAVEPGTITVKNIIKGDFNNDKKVTDKDAIYLLFSTFYSDEYPLNQSGDLNNDGKVDSKDATHLLYYIYFPKIYKI